MNKKRILYLTVLAQLISLVFCFSAWAGWTLDATPTDSKLRAVSGTSASNIFAAGDGGAIVQYDGTSWKTLNSGISSRIFGLWFASEDDVFAAAEWGNVLRYDGNIWSKVYNNSSAASKLRGIWGTAADDIYAVGDGTQDPPEGVLIHFDGDVWEELACPVTVPLQGVWGTNPGNVFAAGGPTGDGNSGGVLAYYDGTDWTTQLSGTPSRFKAVWGMAERMYAVGDLGYIISLNDNETVWFEHDSNTSSDLRGVWGSSKNDVFAVGDSGVIQHYDGIEWTTLNSGVGDDIFGVWGTGPDNVYAVTAAGAILHYDGNPNDPSPSCPFEEAVDSREDLALLRSYRDSLGTEVKGVLLKKLFYAFAPDAAAVIRTNEDLKKGLKQLVSRNKNVLKNMTETDNASINFLQAQEISMFLHQMQKKSGFELKFVLTAVEYGIKLGWLPDLYNVSVE